MCEPSEKVIALICAYNEAKYIRKIIEGTLKYIKLVLVIDDCSTDNTSEEVKKTDALYIKHDVNKGKGCALKTGFSYFIEDKYDAIVTLDGDGQHDPDEIPALLEGLKKYDIVIGTRNKFGTSMPLIRIFTNFSCSLIVSILAFTWIQDSQSGYRAIKYEVLKDISLVSGRFNLESELLIRAGRRGYKIGAVPVKTIYGDETSKMHPIKDPLRFIGLVFRSLFWW
ncbi:MAG TPA: glycosyltransferase family 2 protein [Candidatus Eremiobacteraeota bacterium]|nr:MAG: Undecaprenyl-phosphate mannosyltransferase [bacterium ADurb.Bin363]HPZ10528.1 glycosyltransferase family 2 protein [Candidatus Eremiobacteraeota bacterium]